MRYRLSYLFILSIMLINDPAVSLAQKMNIAPVHWSELPLPPVNGNEVQAGLAGAFAGFSAGIFILAGGANFPEKMPWEGGRKKRYDNIYLWKEQDGALQWMGIAETKLMHPLAYGASVSLHQGVLCAGGETDNGVISNQVFLLSNVDEKNISCTMLPSLKLPLVNASATKIGNKVYIAGGETTSGPTDFFASLDLSQQTPLWQELPALPVSLSHAVAVTQKNEKGRECIYVIGGRTATEKGVSQLHGTVFCFDPSLGRWKEMVRIHSAGKPIHLSASTGVAQGNNSILLFGGDRGELFHCIELFNANIAAEKNEIEKERLTAEKIKLLTAHPGFNKEILVYNTHTNSWSSLGMLPFAAQVTTVAVKQGGKVYIPSGEVKPGIRTPFIHVASIE